MSCGRRISGKDRVFPLDPAGKTTDLATGGVRRGDERTRGRCRDRARRSPSPPRSTGNRLRPPSRWVGGAGRRVPRRSPAARGGGWSLRCV